MVFSAFGADILALIYICIQSDHSIPAVAVARLGILHILVGSSTSSCVIIAVQCTVYTAQEGLFHVKIIFTIMPLGISSNNLFKVQM